MASTQTEPPSVLISTRSRAEPPVSDAVPRIVVPAVEYMVPLAGWVMVEEGANRSADREMDVGVPWTLLRLSTARNRIVCEPLVAGVQL